MRYETRAGPSADLRKAARFPNGHSYTFRYVRLGGRSTVRVHTGIGRDTRTDLFQDRRAYVRDNTSDTATPRNDRGRFVDEIAWGHHRGNRHCPPCESRGSGSTPR